MVADCGLGSRSKQSDASFTVRPRRFDPTHRPVTRLVVDRSESRTEMGLQERPGTVTPHKQLYSDYESFQY